MRVRRMAFVLSVLALGACSGAAPASSPGPSLELQASPTPIVTAAPEASRPTFPPAPTPQIGDFPIGTITTTITPDDLRKAGFTSQHDLNENSGLFTLVTFDNGTWRLIQTSNVPIAQPVFTGKFTSEGNNVAFHVTTPLEFQTEVDTFTWSLTGNTLVFTLVGPDHGISTVVYTAHPWTRG